MRMTESRLRSLIRSVISESSVSAGWGENHDRTGDLLDCFFDVPVFKRFMRERGGSFIDYVNYLIGGGDHNEYGFSELNGIPNFVSNFVEKGVYNNKFFTGDGTQSFQSVSDKWESFKEESSDEVFFEFIDNIINEEAIIDRLPDVIDDKKLRELISGVYSIFNLGYEDSDKKGYLAHLDTNHINKVKNCSETGYVVDTGMGYEIKKEAFKILGFSDNDIGKLCSYNSGSNDDSSYDYHSGVTVIPDEFAIEFRTDY
jgi:hypothetical protein